MSERLKALAEAGVSIWLDDLSRERLNSNNLADLVAESSVVGVTTNPTIFAGALSKGDAYDEQTAELAARDSSVADTIKALTTDDVRDACDVLAATAAATNG
ncbi:MAG: transaldolase, partial [Microlunatus sp.]|nr:transaldolase [Microlunatus sp.]